MNRRGLLGAAGLALVAAGAVILAISLAPPAGRPAGDTPVAVAFYAQNHRFTAPPVLRAAADALDLQAAPKWVQRGVVVTDREPVACRHDARALHVFALPAGGRTYYAVGFILDPHVNAIACAIGALGDRRVAYHPPAFDAVDALVRRGKLEYVAHPEMRALPQAQYPAHDRAMLPVSFQ